MAIDKNSNAFTFGFAIAMVVVVGAILSIVAMSLEPLQKANEADKKRMDILGALNIEATRENAAEKFDQYIVNRIVLNHKGEKIAEKQGEIKDKDEDDAFNVDVRAQYRDKQMDPADARFPVYEAELEGKTYYVVPMAGTGLWGPIWGFMSFESDMNTVHGAIFDHESETPGLGAEINQTPFQSQFEGKEIYENGDLVAITVKKGGAEEGNDHAVDAITGGTITSNGVTEMIQRTLGVYETYFNDKRNNEKNTASL